MIITYLEKTFKKISDRITFYILYFTFQHHTIEEVRNFVSYHEIDYSISLNMDISNSNLDLVLDEAIKLNKEEETRRAAIDEKNKVLLTICALLAAASGVLFTHVKPNWLLLLPIVPILVAVFLILRHFGVQAQAVIDMGSIDWSKESGEVKKELAKSYIDCANFLSPRNDFLVDVYHASHRLLRLGIIALLVVFVIAVFFPADDRNNTQSITINRDLQLPEHNYHEPEPGPPIFRWPSN